jgi:hypothetical protein
MTTPPLEVLERWELHGAIWRLRGIEGAEAVVDLLTCHGEPVDQLRSGDPELLRYLGERPSSEEPAAETGPHS